MGTSTLQQETRSPIMVFDNHDEAYYMWKNMGLRDMVVVHVDAHHDLFIGTGLQNPSIGDYLRWTLKEGIASEAFWVIPTPAFESQAGLENVRAHLKALADLERGAKFSFDADKHIGRVTQHGRTVTACSIESLPEISAPLLLDVDTDYMLVDEPPFTSLNSVPERPWIWPEELAVKLTELARRAEAVDICYSVAGGYTPPMWKHLGDDLAAILTANLSEESLALAASKRRMAEALLDGDLSLHATLRKSMEQDHPEDASLYYWRAIDLLQKGDQTFASQAHARAVELDPCYRYSSGYGGLIMETKGDYEQAEQLFRQASELNELDPLGWYGQGRLAMRTGDRDKAREYLARAASLSDAPAEIHRELAMLSESEGKTEEAMHGYIAYLRLSFAGKSLEQPIATVPDRTYRNPFWSDGYAGLSRVYSAMGNTHLAANCQSQALRLMNPPLYAAAQPLLALMSGSKKKASALRLIGSAVKMILLGLGMGVKAIRRQVIHRRYLRDETGARIEVRICAPIRMRHQGTKAQHQI